MMDELITKRQAIERMNDLMVLELKMTRPPTWNEVYNAIKEIPPVDAVEVVRCKDCIHYKGMAECECVPECGGTMWFCAWGERKDDG